MSALAPTLEAFFTERLLTQKRASAHTVSSYRDALRLMLVFAQNRTGKAPSALDVGDLDAPLIAAFLSHLEDDRGNSVATRNSRLAAVTRCSASPPSVTPSMPPSSSASSPSHRSGPTDPTWPSSPPTRSTPWWPLLTATAGSAVVTMP